VAVAWVFVAYVRTVRTSSGATAVQIVWSSRRGSRRIEHLGSAHSDGELAVLKQIAAERVAAGQGELDLGLSAAVEPGPLPIVGSRAGHLWEALCRAYASLGFEQAAGGDEVFRALVLARIIEPTSKLDALRVLDEVGVVGMVSYRTLCRRLPRYGTSLWRKGISTACAARASLGPASLVLYDVSTLYFETDQGDGFREPGFSKERRLEPQITIGLLTDSTGFPLAVEAFEGNKAETATMVPTLQAFMTAHRLTDITVVADAGMLSEANKKAIERAGLGFILGNRISTVPYVIDRWRAKNPDAEVPDQLILTQPWPAGPTDQRRDQVIYYQYRADRARRALRGINEQVLKAESAIAGKTPIKRNRFITLSGGDKTVNRELEAKARVLAGWKSYITNIANPDPQFVIGAYHQLWRIEKAFRMSKHDLQARPIYHHKRESIEAHLAVVFAALALTHEIETATGWSIKRFVQTARRYRTIAIRAGTQTVTAEEPLPPELADALAQIT
jgi:Transposase DDE domain